jgi:hypothetical protein
MHVFVNFVHFFGIFEIVIQVIYFFGYNSVLWINGLPVVRSGT